MSRIHHPSRFFDVRQALEKARRSPEAVQEAMQLLSGEEVGIARQIHSLVLITNNHDAIVEILRDKLLSTLEERDREFAWGIADSLVKHGYSSGHMHLSDCEEYDFVDFSELRKVISRIAKAWSDIVTIYAGKTRGEDEFWIHYALK